MPTLSSYEIEELVGSILVLLIFCYAIFWSFNIRSGLSVKLYRRQILGIGLVSIGLAYFSFVLDGGGVLLNPCSATAAGCPPGDLVNTLSFALLFFAPLPLFYWTDLSILAARESDPLGHDYFHWSRLRIILWTVILFTLAVVMITIIYDAVIHYPNPNLINPSEGIFQGLVGFSFITILSLPLASSAVLLPLIWKRSKDLALRRHLKWFALAALFFGFGILFSLSYGQVGILSFVFEGLACILLALSGYFFYKSARATTPLYSFSEKIEAK